MAAKRLDSETVENTDENINTPEFLTETRFDQLNLPPVVMKGIEDAGFSHCSPIQAQVLPITLEGKDIAGQAQTGTGKTAAFLVTLFARMHQLKIPKGKTPTALVIAPTRELASQIMEEAKVLGGHTGYRIIQIIGGIDYDKQAKQLRDGVDIVICTPGRVIDYIKQDIFKTASIKLLVIDEADRLLDLGFEKDMRFLLKRLPKYDRRQSMLFSATLSYRVMELTYEYMNLPEFIAVTPETVTVKGIDQVLYHVGMDEKLPLLLGLLKREKWHRLLIFMNTKAGVEWLAQKLKKNGWPAEGITGDLPQNKRFRLMEQFKSGKLKILIATDVASRGLHVDDISHVINYDLPQDAENYVHRIGRTARAGTTGRAISLACERYVYHLEPIETVLTDKIPVAWTDETLLEKDTAGPIRVAPSHSKSSPQKPRPQRSGGRPVKKAPPPNGRKSTRFPDRDTIRQRLQKGYFPGTFFGFEPVKKAQPDKSATQTAPPKNQQSGENSSNQKPVENTKGQRPVKQAKPQKAAKETKAQESGESTKGQRPTKNIKPQNPARNNKAQKPVQDTKAQESGNDTKSQSPAKSTKPQKPLRNTKAQTPEKETKAQESGESTKGRRPTKSSKPQKPARNSNAQKSGNDTKSQSPEKSTKPQKPLRNTKAQKPVKETNAQESGESTKAQRPTKSTKLQKPARNSNAQESGNDAKSQSPAKSIKPHKPLRKTKAKKPEKDTKAQKSGNNTKDQKPEKSDTAQKTDNRKQAARRGRPRKKPPTKTE